MNEQKRRETLKQETHFLKGGLPMDFLLKGSYWQVASFSSSNRKQEQGFSQELNHIPSVCVLSIKAGCCVCSMLQLFIYLFTLQMHEL